MASKAYSRLAIQGKRFRKNRTIQERLTLVELLRHSPAIDPVTLALFELLIIWHDAPLRYQVEI